MERYGGFDRPETTAQMRFWEKVDKSGECWIWTAGKDRGYGRFGIRKGLTVNAHVFSWQLAHPDIPIPPGWFICHNCPGEDNPSCVNPAHLYLGTHRDNTDDAVRKGQYASGDRNGMRAHPERRAYGDRSGPRRYPERYPKGEASRNAKLTEESVRFIRAHAGAMPQRALAALFGVHQQHVSEIVNRRVWAWLD